MATKKEKRVSVAVTFEDYDKLTALAELQGKTLSNCAYQIFQKALAENDGEISAILTARQKYKESVAGIVRN